MQYAADYRHYFSQIIANTGRYVCRKGHPQACLENPHLKYSLVTYKLNNVENPALNTGICMPRSCPDTIVTEYI